MAGTSRERENPLIALGAYQGSSGTEASLFTWVIPIRESGNAQTGELPLGDEAHTRREGGQPEIVVQWYTVARSHPGGAETSGHKQVHRT